MRFALPLASKEYAFNAPAVRQFKAAAEKLTTPALNEVDISMNEIEELETALQEAEFSRHANALSWGCRDYVSFEGSGPDLEALLHLN